MPFQTPNTLREELGDALRAAGIEATLQRDALLIDDRRYRVEVIERSHPTPAELGDLPENDDPTRLCVVVADRLGKASREVLRSRGYGWFDRRGKLRLWALGLHIDAATPPPIRSGGRRRVASVFSPTAREVAFRILLEPDRQPSPRRLAGELDRSPGYVSTVLATFAEEGLLGDDGRPLCPELFWALAEAWPHDWHYLVDEPNPIRNRFHATVTGAHGASAWAAPILMGEHQVVELLLPDERSLRLVLERSTVAPRSTKARTAVRVDPLASSEVISTPVLDEPPTHPLVSALDLAADQRGRETVEHWTPENQDLAILGLLEVFLHTDWIQDNWIDALLEHPLPEAMWPLMAAACWKDHHCASLASIYRHARAPSALRSPIRRRLDELASASAYWSELISERAPLLLSEEPYRSHELQRHLDNPATSPETLAEQARRRGFMAGRARGSISSQVAAFLNARPDSNPAETKAEAERIADHVISVARPNEVDDGDAADADAPVRPTDRVSDHHGARRWHEWSSGPDPGWWALCDKADAAAPLPPTKRSDLLNTILGEDPSVRAMPLVDLLPHLDAEQSSRALQAIRVASQFISDLHLRAKVLAEASRHAPGDQRQDFIDLALVAARATAEQTDPSPLAGPEPGGIHGLLAVAQVLSGPQRHELLDEIARTWSAWVDPPAPSTSEPADRRRDRRMMFHQGGDKTPLLLRLLADARQFDSLELVFETTRRVAGADGNTVEGFLSMAAWPALLDGSVELAAFLVGQARIPTPWRVNKEIDRDLPATDPPDHPLFPDELIGFRRVW